MKCYIAQEGSVNNIETEIFVDEQAVPVFWKAGDPHWTTHEMVDKEIHNLFENDIAYPVGLRNAQSGHCMRIGQPPRQ